MLRKRQRAELPSCEDLALEQQVARLLRPADSLRESARRAHSAQMVASFRATRGASDTPTRPATAGAGRFVVQADHRGLHAELADVEEITAERATAAIDQAAALLLMMRSLSQSGEAAEQ